MTIKAGGVRSLEDHSRVPVTRRGIPRKLGQLANTLEVGAYLLGSEKHRRCQYEADAEAFQSVPASAKELSLIWQSPRCPTLFVDFRLGTAKLLFPPPRQSLFDDFHLWCFLFDHERNVGLDGNGMQLQWSSTPLCHRSN